MVYHTAGMEKQMVSDNKHDSDAGGIGDAGKFRFTTAGLCQFCGHE
jgi:hypothetical protein